jgi:hypothetical protein
MLPKIILKPNYRTVPYVFNSSRTACLVRIGLLKSVSYYIATGCDGVG